MTRTEILKRLKASKKNIAKERDKLREIVEEYAAIVNSSDSAISALEEAIETIFQKV